MKLLRWEWPLRVYPVVNARLLYLILGQRAAVRLPPTGIILAHYLHAKTVDIEAISFPVHFLSFLFALPEPMVS